MTMFDLSALEKLDSGLGAFVTPVPGLTRDLRAALEAPDRVRGGVAPVSGLGRALDEETI